MNRSSTSYLLWLCWLLGFAGFHRIYNRKFLSGFLWFCTWGLFGVGQLVDLLLIPSMVDEHNLRVRQRLGLSSTGIPQSYGTAQVQEPFQPASSQSPVQLPRQEQLMVELARAAQKRGGKLSVTQGVIDTGGSFEEVQQTLNEMLTKGYIGVGNHSDTGVVVYDFFEL
ncbi:MAG: NINE protein [Cyanophyceae cyanobacterium]